MQILQKKRNIEIYELFHKGVSAPKIAKIFDISRQRVLIIVKETKERGLVK